jgi:hypothetical protein
MVDEGVSQKVTYIETQMSKRQEGKDLLRLDDWCRVLCERKRKDYFRSAI